MSVPSGHKLRWWWYLLLLFLGAVPYLNTLPAPFTSDDVLVSNENPMLADSGNVLRYFTADVDWLVPRQLGHKPLGHSRYGLYRPLLAASYHLDYWLFGLWTPGWRLLNLLLHLVVTLLVAALGVRLLGSARAALLAGAIFAVHPVHAETVASLLGGRAGLLAAMFCLASWLLWLRARGTKGIVQAAWLGLSLLVFFLGLSSKENAVMLPLAMGIWGYAMERVGLRQLAKQLSPHLLVLAFYVTVRLLVVGRLAPSSWEATFGPLPSWRLVLVLAALPIRYLLWAAWPLPYRHPNCYLDFPQRLSPVVAAAAALLLVMLVALAILVIHRRSTPRGRRLPAAGLLVFLTWLLPVSHIVPFAVVMAQRFLYLPSTAYCLVAGWSLRLLAWRRRRLALGLAGLVLCAYGTGLLWQNHCWTDTERLYRGLLECRPRSAYAYNNLGTWKLRSGRLAEALEMFTRAAALDPKNPSPLYNRGLVLQRLGRSAEAEQAYRQTLRVAPHHAQAANNLGVLLSRRGYDRQAIKLLRLAIAADPAHPQPLVNLAELLSRRSRADEAERLLRTALDIDPRLVDASLNLGRLLESQKRYAEAEQVYRQAVAAHPENAMVRNNLANLLARRGDNRKAQRLYREALQIAPDLAPARYNLGLLLLRAGQAEAAARQLLQATHLRPGHLPGWLALGRAELARGDISGARQALQQAERLAPDDPRSNALKASVEAAAGKNKERG